MSTHPRHRRLWLKSLLLVLATGLSVALPAPGQGVPRLVNYQGRLTDETGKPLPTGVYSVQFRVWPAAAGVDGLVWAREYSLSVVEGVFHVILGASGGREVAGPAPAANDISLAFTESDRFLGLTVTKDAKGATVPNPKELVPRQQILSAPYAFNALEAGRARAIADNGVVSGSIRDGEVKERDLADGSVTLWKMAPRASGTNDVGVGGVAVSEVLSPNGLSGEYNDLVPELKVKLRTTGRPVVIALAAGERGTAFTSIQQLGSTSRQAWFLRDGKQVIETLLWSPAGPWFAPSAINFIDWKCPPGEHVFQFAASGLKFVNVVLVVYEL